MKKSFLLSVVAFFSLTGWSQTIYLSNEIDVAPSGHGGFRPRITLLNDSIPVVSWGHGGFFEDIYSARMQNGSFLPPVQINMSGVNAFCTTVDGPSIITNNDTVFVAYMAEIPEEAIVVSRSFDGGYTFVDTNIVYTTIGHHVEFPALTRLSSSGRLVMAFLLQTSAGAPTHIMSSYSNDEGSTWSKPDTLSALHPGEPCECCPIGIASKGDTVAVAYRNNEINVRDFYASVSYNQANAWQTGGILDTTHWLTGCPMIGIDIGITGDSLVGAFVTHPASFNQAKTNTLSLADGQLGKARFVCNVSFAQSHASLWVENDTVAIVWQQSTSGNTDCFMSFYTPSQPISTPVQITTALGIQQTPNVVYHKGVFHLVWHDSQAGRVKYRKAAFSPFTAVTELISGDQLIHIWPNPAANEITIDGPDKISGRITDVSGKTLVEFADKNQLHQALLNATPGVYMVSTPFQALRIIKL